jgi:HD-like signal output (HDOD) protein
VVASFDEDLWYGSDAKSELAAEEKAAKSVAAQVGRIIGTKPFPIAAQRLSELTRNADTPIDPVVAVLESDPALSARLLRLVNSAGFALRTSCTSVRHAAMLVGNRRLNQVSTTAAILDMYDSSTEMAAQVLEHATIVGALCRYLAGHLGLPPDEMFTCGFLHDIGKLMLLECEGEAYRKILSQYADEADTVYIKERELYGYDHALLAGHVLAAWNIPAPVPKVVAWHHQVTRAYADTPEVARMVSVLRLADALSFSLFKVFPEHEVERLARTEAASYLEISEPQLAAMWDPLLALAERARAGFRGEREEDLTKAEVIRPQAPANDNEPRQEPAPEPEVASVPRVFPCVVCGTGTFANTCAVCHGYVCPNHQGHGDEWCALCQAEYRALELKLPSWTFAALGSAIGAMFAGGVVGAAGAVSSTLADILIAPGLLALAAAIVLGSWHRWLRRLWLMRTAPDRAGLAPALSNARNKSSETLLAMPVSKRIVNAFNLNQLGPTVERVEAGSSGLSLRAPPADDPFVSSLRPHARHSGPPSSQPEAAAPFRMPALAPAPIVLPIAEPNSAPDGANVEAAVDPEVSVARTLEPAVGVPGGTVLDRNAPEDDPDDLFGSVLATDDSDGANSDEALDAAPNSDEALDAAPAALEESVGFDEDSWFDSPPDVQSSDLPPDPQSSPADTADGRAPGGEIVAGLVLDEPSVDQNLTEFTTEPDFEGPATFGGLEDSLSAVDSAPDSSSAPPLFSEAVLSHLAPVSAPAEGESARIDAELSGLEPTFRTAEAWRSVEALQTAANGW